MRIIQSVLWICTILPHIIIHALDGDDDAHQIVLELHAHDEALARSLAVDHHLVYKRPLGDLDGHFIYHYIDSAEGGRSKRSVSQTIQIDPRIKLHTPQIARRRVKRDMTTDEEDPDVDRARRYRRSAKSAEESVRHPWPTSWADPMYNQQWYLHGGAQNGWDMKVREAWRLGYSGRGVAVSILDDGIQLDHKDLAANYDPMSSSDVNDHDLDPTPRDNNDNKHGTRCAGEVAAIAGNTECGVGIAFNASIGGVRMLDGPVSDSVEAAALALNQQHIDIYSASWGPEDDGATFDGPGPLARKAFTQGILKGRNGLGNIFVWASGNGGNHYDSCSADGYTTSIYTLSISSCTFDNGRPWYLEECPSTIATTYSSASMNQPAIVTVDVPKGCTNKHTGTSASAPLAAGIIALALEANPQLTWRDVQHIILRTANSAPLMRNAGWTTNGVGRRVSSKFGYGVMDAEQIVKLAKRWTSAPEARKCEYEYHMSNNTPQQLRGRFRHEFSLIVGDCEGHVRYLEHVHAKVTLRYSKRGDIQITLISPSGTKSLLLPPRRRDNNNSGFHQWPFLTVHVWGESPVGEWKLIVENVGSAANEGAFHGWSLVTYGTGDPAQAGDPLNVAAVRSSNTPVHVVPRAALEDDPGLDPHMRTEEEWVDEVSAETTAVPFHNAGDCDAECDATGCLVSKSPTDCHKCRHFAWSMRQRTFKCTAEACPSLGYFEVSPGIVGEVDCRRCKGNCKKCKDSEVCLECQSDYKLISMVADVTRNGAHQNGECVEACPEELVEDDTKTKCVDASNRCPAHQYVHGKSHKCVQCHAACADCSGGTSSDCVICAVGYRKADGECKKCCEGNVTTNCVSCANTSFSAWLPFNIRSPLTFIVLMSLLCIAVFVCVFFTLNCRDKCKQGQMYSPVPVKYDLQSVGIMNGGRNVLGDSSDDSMEDELYIAAVKTR